ncbi:hypothetical protein ES706_01420 [subsurface metagenome]
MPFRFVSHIKPCLTSPNSLLGWSGSSPCPGKSLAGCHIWGKSGALVQLTPSHNSGNHAWDILLLALFTSYDWLALSFRVSPLHWLACFTWVSFLYWLAHIRWVSLSPWLACFTWVSFLYWLAPFAWVSQ